MAGGRQGSSGSVGELFLKLQGKEFQRIMGINRNNKVEALFKIYNKLGAVTHTWSPSRSGGKGRCSSCLSPGIGPQSGQL